MIGCVYIPHFMAALHQRDHPELEAMPLVVFETETQSRQIVSISPSAEQAGARLGMTLRQVEAECGELLCVPANTLTARRALSTLLETLANFTPQVEIENRVKAWAKRPQQAAIKGDEDATIIYLDLGKLREEEGYDAARVIYHAILEQIQLKSALSLSSGKFTSRVVATSLTPREVSVIRQGREAAVLATYPATLLPIYPEEAWRLSLLGLNTLGEIAALPASAMLELFGKQGRKFHQLAKGRDSTPVALYEPPQQEFAATQLDPPVDDRSIIDNILRSLVEGLARRLERQGKVTQAIELAIVLEDGAAHTRELVLQHPSSSPVQLTRIILDLFATLRVLSRIAELEITLSGIQTAQVRQLSMFDLEGTPQDRLRAVLKNLIARHGSDAFYRVDLADRNALLLERGFTLKPLDEP